MTKNIKKTIDLNDIICKNYIVVLNEGSSKYYYKDVRVL